MESLSRRGMSAKYGKTKYRRYGKQRTKAGWHDAMKVHEADPRSELRISYFVTLW